MASFVPERSHGARGGQRLELPTSPSSLNNLPAFPLSPALEQSSPDLMSPTSRDSMTRSNSSRVSDPELSLYAYPSYRTAIEQGQTALIKLRSKLKLGIIIKPSNAPIAKCIGAAWPTILFTVRL
ncbi:hypothetical protein OIDMADRAFT_53933 [Oidiodendron maius Zn]|uniref:Uncharacterized protein n=1 Tax=Oidiodendron maius (strain Zn) TaxID=913774 RepID=A0A0C3DKB4_OIDMZ|nr:hypothetical protein OIDMADRAFT_53933 [Oidiodendron maius Zn]